jgi:hypothetical protein
MTGGALAERKLSAEELADKGTDKLRCGMEERRRMHSGGAGRNGVLYSADLRLGNTRWPACKGMLRIVACWS